MRYLIILCLGGVMLIGNVEASRRVWKGRAVLEIRDSKLEFFKKAVKKIISPTLKEKGCISYEAFHIVDEDGVETNRFEFHELWVSKEAMMIEHKDESAHMKEFFKEIRNGEEDSFVEKFTLEGSWVDVIE